MRWHALGSAVIAVVLTAAAIGVVLVSLPEDAERTPQAATPVGDVVATAQGEVRGVVDGDVRAWRGIPYAAAPTGVRRWRAPRPHQPWDDVRDAGRYGAPCIQPEEYRFGEQRLKARRGSSENCLFLNVSRPAASTDARTDALPVVVWLHGGGFFAGTGSTASEDATALVERGIVLVTVNYRLGRLGFFAHPALKQGVANLGLLDQVAALEWVRANIAAFGGDAANVTLAGGSAGAMAVNALMSSSRGEGLFDRAIAQSAPGDERALTLRAARRRGAEAFPGLSARQLRALPAERLLSSTFNALSGDAPIIDAVLPEPSAVAFAAGREQPVPYLVGTTAAEFSDADFTTFGVDPVALRAALGGARHDALVAAYGASYDQRVLDDLVFGLPALERAVTHGRSAPTYRYVFDGERVSGHGSEGAYVFDTLRRGRPGRLSDAVADYWVAFARTGEPAVEGLPTWPVTTGGERAGYLALTARGPVARVDEPRLGPLRALRAALS